MQELDSLVRIARASGYGGERGMEQPLQYSVSQYLNRIGFFNTITDNSCCYWTSDTKKELWYKVRGYVSLCGGHNGFTIENVENYVLPVCDIYD